MKRIILIVWALAGCTAAGSAQGEALSPEIKSAHQELPDRNRCLTTQPMVGSNEFTRGNGCAWEPPSDH